ncbi:hypothetical protein [Shewanella benthica]|uniref:hypothetical protein n=1 Tax=Shewanella benthica TaxID=43661 RepID=UPI0012FE691E|nr:hypothetical protein [Shewanella benthica]
MAEAHLGEQLRAHSLVQLIFLLQHQRHICHTFCLDTWSKQRKSAAHKTPSWIN